ncbi:zinc finger protein 70-like [Armigeres subalbatus]|uniref:zinc finger protein 70-like n=1 Tax=Armigeres subalbatus TaxID=124917 RepID=UPI002ED5A3E3
MDNAERCRICLSDSQHGLVSLQMKVVDNLSVADLITSISAVLISDEDLLPRCCCEICTNKLLHAYALANLCRETDKKLRTICKDRQLALAKEDTVREASPEMEGQSSNDNSMDQGKCNDDETEIGLTVCCACRTDFETTEAFTDHISKVHEPDRTSDDSKKPYQCDICFKRYFKKTSLNRHKRMGAIGSKIGALMNEEDPTDHRCCGCRKDFASADDLKEHSSLEHINERVVDDLRPYECDICFKRYSKKASLSRHFRERLVEKRPRLLRRLASNQCCGCHQKFSSEEQLNRHSKQIHEPDRREDINGVRPFECGICFSRYFSQEAFNRHRTYICMDQLYKCQHEKCDKSFVKRIMLRFHERKFHNGIQSDVIGPYQCSLCGKTFMQPSSLTNHEKTHTENKRFECTVCRKTFFSKGNLQTHLKLHGNPYQEREPRYECPVCRCRFKTPNYLEVHSRIHTGEKPYQCRHCSKHFAHASGYKRHLLTHSSLKPFVCQFCDRGFSNRPNMLIHEKSHGTERNVKCDICEKFFVHERYMKKHRKRHFC